MILGESLQVMAIYNRSAVGIRFGFETPVVGIASEASSRDPCH